MGCLHFEQEIYELEVMVFEVREQDEVKTLNEDLSSFIAGPTCQFVCKAHGIL